MTSATEISHRILEAVMAQKLAPGARLGEQQLAILFDCSRTVVREALMRLSTRGIVTVSARRGWYVIEPSQDEARDAFEARRVLELGLLHQLTSVEPSAVQQLRHHLQREKAAIAGDDVGARSFLLGDFHVCLAECLGNALLADTLRDFTARTMLIALRYQSSHDAAQSCEDHVRIVDALEAGDIPRAEALMAAHIGTVQSSLRPPAAADPLAQLRHALAPLHPGSAPRGGPASASNPAAPQPGVSSDPSTYLGALL